MKTLKESLLDDINKTIEHGDEIVNDINDVFNQIKEYFSNASNWEKDPISASRGGRKLYSIRFGRIDKFGKVNNTEKFEKLRLLLQMIGINADFIYMDIEENDQWVKGKPISCWTLFIKMVDTISKDIFTIKVHIPRIKAKIFKSVINNYIKPAFKDINKFKKFINDMQDANETILD